MWRVRDRATFEALRRHGHRARRGPVTVVHLPAPTSAAVVPSTSVGHDPEAQVRVAFAVGRKVGNAVVRNRLRRRLRSIMRELEGVGLHPGAYLVTTTPAAAQLAYVELRDQVASACAAAAAATERRSKRSPV